MKIPLAEYIEKPELDRTSYTEEQLSFLRATYPLLNDTWQEINSNGVKVEILQGRFGNVVQFFVDDFGWMFTNPIDLMDHKKILTQYSGNILFTGLGLGLCIVFANHNPNINSVTVIEKEQRVIDVIAPMLDLSKTSIICADADNYTLSSNFDFIFLDHAKERPEDSVIQRYTNYSANVDNWYDLCKEVGDQIASN
jgi:hypothetical protein